MIIVRPITFLASDCTINIAETEAPAWDVATSYALGDEVVKDHAVYVSAIDPNLGIDPALEDQSLVGARWLQKSPTNAFAFMDGVLSNRTMLAGSIILTIDNLSGFDTAVLFGVTAETVDFVAKSLSDQVVLTQTINVSGREVADWWDWFFDPFNAVSDKVVVQDIPANAVKLEITLNGSTTELGEIVIGDQIDIGVALVEGTEGQVISYTKTEFNAYGVLTNIKRPTRTDMRFTCMVTADRFRSIEPIMRRLAGDLVAAVGSEDRPSTIHFGVLGAIRWPERLPNHYIYEFTLRGVT